MESMKRLWIGLAMAPVLAAFLGAAAVAGAADEHVKCETMKNGKAETHQASSAEACTKMGGKVVTAKKHKKKY